MQNLESRTYTDLMLPWLKVLPDFLRTSEYNPELTYYGTGESASWPIQSNCNVFAALAVLGTDPALPEAQRLECRETALKLLRYTMSTHVSGSDLASDGKQWGCHWISVLGLERMAHGVNAIRDYLTAADQQNLRRMLLTEADFLLEKYEIVASMYEPGNKPESNIWNGGILMRAALDYPDAPNAKRYLEKGTRFMLNGISYPTDAECDTVFNGKKVRDWHIAPNFTANFSLDHHGYLNVGYMVICLSNLAMLHFNFRERGQQAPPELYWHLEELWKLVKKLTFDDGRLLRVGGDTRSRYTYCQNYAIPAWLLAADLFDDADAVEFERRWLEQVRTEAAHAGDGGFYSRRLANIRDKSYFYFTRLESDMILCLSYGAYWRRKFDLSAAKTEPREFAWQDEYHGATVLREPAAIRSWVWHGGQGATAICVPPHRSDMAEWQCNLRGELRTVVNQFPVYGPHEHQLFDGGFLNSGECEWRQLAPLGEGEGEYHYARQQTVCAALPDGKTMLVMDYAVITKEITLQLIKGLGLKMPNDLFNGSKRHYQGNNFDEVLPGNPGRDDSRIIDSDYLVIDGELSVQNVYGSDKLTLYRPAEPQIIIRKPHGPWLHSLYADEICSVFTPGPRRYRPGTVVIDCGAAVTAGNRPGQAKRIKSGMEYTTPDGTKYLLTASFDGGDLPEVPATLIARTGRAALWRITPGK